MLELRPTFTFFPFAKLFSFSILFCFEFTLYALHFCMTFVSELQFCMTRALVDDDAFLLLPFALLPNCFRFPCLFVCIAFLYGVRACIAISYDASVWWWCVCVCVCVCGRCVCVCVCVCVRERAFVRACGVCTYKLLLFQGIQIIQNSL